MSKTYIKAANDQFADRRRGVGVLPHLQLKAPLEWVGVKFQAVKQRALMYVGFHSWYQLNSRYPKGRLRRPGSKPVDGSRVDIGIIPRISAQMIRPKKPYFITMVLHV